LQQENEQLLSALASKGLDPSMVLDATAIAPLVVDACEADKLQQRISGFHSARLPEVVEASGRQDDREYNRIISRYRR